MSVNHHVFIILVAFGLTLFIAGGAAAQGCCSPGSPATGGLEKGSLEFGQLRVLPSVDYTHLGTYINGTHEVDNTLGRKLDAWVYGLDVEYGIRSRLTIMASVSYSTRSRRLQGMSVDGTPISFDADTRGFGDLILLTKYRLLSWDLRSQREVDVGAGVKFPTGAYDIMHDGIKVSRDLLPGSGAYHMLLWSYFYQSFRPGPVGISLSLNYNLPGVSEDEYRYGQELNYVGGVVYELTDLVDLYAQVSGKWSGSDEFVGNELPGTGGHWLYLQPGINLKPWATISIYAVFQTPVYHNLNGTQLTPDAGLRIGSVIVFDPR